MKTPFKTHALSLLAFSIFALSSACGTQNDGSSANVAGTFKDVPFTAQDAVYTQKDGSASEYLVFIGDQSGICGALQKNSYTGKLLYVDVYNPNGVLTTGQVAIDQEGAMTDTPQVTARVSFSQDGLYSPNAVEASSGTVTLSIIPKSNADTLKFDIVANDGKGGKLTGTVSAVFCKN